MLKKRNFFLVPYNMDAIILIGGAAALYTYYSAQALQNSTAAASGTTNATTSAVPSAANLGEMRGYLPATEHLSKTGALYYGLGEINFRPPLAVAPAYIDYFQVKDSSDGFDTAVTRGIATTGFSYKIHATAAGTTPANTIMWIAKW